MFTRLIYSAHLNCAMAVQFVTKFSTLKFLVFTSKQLIFECTVVHLFQNAMQKREALFAVRKKFNFETLGNKQCIFWFLFVMYCTNFLR